MNENMNFQIPDELLEAASAGASFTPYTDKTIKEKLDSGYSPCCDMPLVLITRTNQQSGTGIVVEYYYCGACHKIYQKIIYLTNDYVWGEFKA